MRRARLRDPIMHFKHLNYLKLHFIINNIYNLFIYYIFYFMYGGGGDNKQEATYQKY